ncbi:MAG: hypothetical protein ACRD2I_00010 [Vicinamibacterales bacterium]
MIDESYVQYVAERVLALHQVKSAPLVLRPTVASAMACMIALQDRLSETSASEVAQRVNHQIHGLMQATLPGL